MVFENLTLFELNLENARIGPRFRDEEDAEMAASEEIEASASAGGSRLGPVIGFLFLVGLGAALAYWRSRGDGESFDGDGGEQITIESAAEQ